MDTVDQLSQQTLWYKHSDTGKSKVGKLFWRKSFYKSKGIPAFNIVGTNNDIEIYR